MSSVVPVPGISPTGPICFGRYSKITDKSNDLDITPAPDITPSIALHSCSKMVRNRHHHHGFSKVHGFANRFETGCRYQCATGGEHSQVFFAVDLVESKRTVKNKFFRSIRIVPKAMQLHILVFPMPVDNLRAEAVMCHVNEYKRTLLWNEPGNLLAEQRRHHRDFQFGRGRYFAERQGKPVGRKPRCRLRIEVDQELVNSTFFREK